jgi:hypothetical protein
VEIEGHGRRREYRFGQYPVGDDHKDIGFQRAQRIGEFQIL